MYQLKFKSRFDKRGCRETLAELYHNNSIISIGTSVKNPNDKEDNKALGQKYALEKAIAKARFPKKETRKEIWLLFFNRSKKARAIINQ